MAYIDEYRTEFSEDRKKVLKFTSEISDYSIPEGTEDHERSRRHDEAHRCLRADHGGLRADGLHGDPDDRARVTGKANKRTDRPRAGTGLAFLSRVTPRRRANRC